MSYFASGRRSLRSLDLRCSLTRNQSFRSGRKDGVSSLPRYVEIAREGPDHKPRFTAEVQIDGVAPERGHGANKRAAEQAAALAMLLREGVWRAPVHD